MGSFLAAGRRVGVLLALGVLPVAVAAAFMAIAARHSFGFDFSEFWNAAHAIRDGRSPYPQPAEVAAAHAMTPYAFFTLPPVIAVVLSPLALLPFGPAAAVFGAGLAGSLAGALRLLGVRDWRCYGAVAASFPVLISIRLGTITPLLVLAVALAWRYRDRPLVAGAAVGAAVVAKLFLWPLVVWLLWTRRLRAAAIATAGGAVVTLATWALLGFRGLREYPALLHALSNLESRQGFSLAAAAARLGLPQPQVSWLGLAVPAAVTLFLAAGARPRAKRDAALLGAAVGSALLLTPILWVHYFALLLVPVAIRRRSFGPEWLLLPAFWISPVVEPAHLPAWRIGVALALTLAMVGARIAPRPTLSRLPGGKP